MTNENWLSKMISAHLVTFAVEKVLENQEKSALANILRRGALRMKNDREKMKIN